MTNAKSQFDTQLQKWAKDQEVEDLIHSKDIFVVVDKYNKPIDSKFFSKKESGIDNLSAIKKQKLESLKALLPYDTTYFKITYDKRNNIFLIKKKTPIQNILNIWALIMIVWALYRWYFQTSLPVWFDEFIAKPVVFILPVYNYITLVEKKPFLKGVSLDALLPSKSILVGIGIGVVFFITGLISFYTNEQIFSVTSILSALQTPLWLIVIIALATSISEEIVARGFVLKRLYEDSKNAYTSAFYTSILFFFMHIPIIFTNDSIVGSVLLQVMVIDILFSLAVSFLYIQSKNLYLPILIHTLYNLSIYLFSIG